MTAIKGYKINIKGLAYAVITKDDSTGIETGAITKIPKLMELTMSPNVQEGQLYGDGSVSDAQAVLESIAVTMNLNKLPLKDRAIMQGYEYSKGVVEEGTDNVAPYIAMAFEVETTTKKSEYVWLYKGKLTPPSDDLKQREGGITYSTSSANFLFIPREFDGKIRKFADGNDETIEPLTVSEWFTKVPGTI